MGKFSFFQTKKLFLLLLYVLLCSVTLSADPTPNPDDFKTQPGTPKTPAEQEAELAKLDAQVPEEAKKLQLMNPFAYNNPDLRKKTYDAHFAKAKSTVLEFKSKAEKQLKNPFQTSFLYFLDGLGSSFIIYDDPREPDQLAGEQSMVDFEQIANKMFSKYLVLQASLDGLNLDPAATDQNSTPSPDPRTDIRLAHAIKMANGKLAPGKDNAEKAQNFIAEAFERMVRIFIAGSDQLVRDTGVPWKGRNKIAGMYKGFTPDLLNSTKEDKVIPGNFYSEWANCGIANMSNGLFKYFKFPDDQYRDESPGENHQCRGGGDAQAIARGDMVTVMMSLMKKMQIDLKTKGKVIQASAYGVVDYCASMRAELASNRDLIKEDREKLYAGLGKQKDVKDNVECAENEKFSGNSSRAGGKMDGVQMRSCMLASMQNEVELNLMTKYMYCTWRSVAGEVIKRFTGALVGQSKIQEQNKTAAVKPQNLYSKISDFFFREAHANILGSNKATGKTPVGSNEHLIRGSLTGTGGFTAYQQGQQFKRLKADAAKNQFEGFVNCKDGMGIFKTGMLPPLPTYLPARIPYPLEPNVAESLAELAFQTHDAPSLEAGKTMVMGLSICDRLCYGARKSADLAAQIKSEKAEEYKQKYLAGLAACSQKIIKTDMMSVWSQIKSDCSCEVDLPQTPPPVNLNIGTNLENARDLTGKQLANQIESETPEPESNVVDEPRMDIGAATAGQIENVKKTPIHAPKPFVEAGPAKEAAAMNENAPPPSMTVTGFELKQGQTGVLKAKDIQYNLDPNSEAYHSVSRAFPLPSAGKSGSPKPTVVEDTEDLGTSGAKFGADAKGVPTRGTPDPEDYFSLIEVEDDIFKIITRRYEQKSKLWFAEELGKKP